MARGARLARAGGRRRWTFGPTRKTEPVHLADDGIAGDAAEFSCDLAGGQAVRPQFFEELDPLVRPAHWVFSLSLKALDGIQPRRRARHRAPDAYASGMNKKPVARDVVLPDQDATIGSDSPASAHNALRAATNSFSLRIGGCGAIESGIQRIGRWLTAQGRAIK